MVEGVAFIAGSALAASMLQGQSTNLIVIGAVIIGGIFAWRQKRGDFYKELAQERKDENAQLRGENERLREMTDITPLARVLEKVTAALERDTETNRQVVATNGDIVAKLAEMNGSVRAHGEAMKALADHLIVDEAARALLATAAGAKPDLRRRTQ